jgi:hypothetical protein
MAGHQKHGDEAVILAFNDRRAFPTLEHLRLHLGYQNTRSFMKALKRCRDRNPGRMIDRKAVLQEAWRKGEKTADRKAGKVVAAAIGDPKVRRWLLTAAQDETPIDAAFWTNFLAYGTRIGAEILVGGFTYNKSLFEDHASRTAVFDQAVRPYLIHDNRHLGPLLFAAKMNILPTAVRPLSGLESYSRGDWAVFPHAKVQLQSVPALPGKHPAMVMTTGACTGPNYIEKKAGLKAEFHHQIGGVVVEVDSANRVFCRQIGAASDGSFQDLDAMVRDGEVTFGNRVEAITWGDIHREKIDPTVAMACWGFDVASEQVVSQDSIIAALRPRHQFFHDLLDFRARNHHRRGDHVHAKEMIVKQAESVDEELAMCARFLRATQRDDCQSVVVASNHNDALLRWLRETDPRGDPANLKTWCELNLEWHRQIEAGADDFDLIRWAMNRHDPRRLDDIIFVPRGGSYLICQDRGGIECGLHGDCGPNGARGSALNLNRVSVRMTIGHAHSAQILDGVHVVGLCGLFDQGYNAGSPSGWSHTQGITYANSRRTLLTIIDGKYRA